MTLLTSSIYSGAEDLKLMVELLVAVRPAGRVADYPGILALHELLGLSEVRANTRLWFNSEGRLMGFAFVDSFNNLRFEFDPSQTGAALESEIISWGLDCLQRPGPYRAAASQLGASCRDDDPTRIAWLKRHGFELQDSHVLHMARSLQAPIPEPITPLDFRIRAVRGVSEAEVMAALHRAAFGTEYMNIERRLALMNTPDYDPGLDLVAVTSDGQPVAYCLCTISKMENTHTGRQDGYSDVVATHPHFRGCGLARALLLTGLHELKARGMEMAKLSTGSENLAMQQVATQAGFIVEAKTVLFAKPVAAN